MPPATGIAFTCAAQPGLRPEGLARLTEAFTDTGVQRFFAWLSPGPDMDAPRRWLAEAGFVPRMQWTRYPTLVRESLDPPPFNTRLDIREVSADEVRAGREQLGATMWDEFLRTAGKDGFYHFMAFDGERPVAIGALGVFEDLGHLHSAATTEPDRQRGAQSALIAARIAKARALGCHAIVVETLTMLEPSLRNLERAGFQLAFEKEVYEWSVGSGQST